MAKWLAFVPHPYTDKYARNWSEHCTICDVFVKALEKNQWTLALTQQTEDTV